MVTSPELTSTRSTASPSGNRESRGAVFKSNASCGGIGSLYMCIPAALRITLHRECGWTEKLAELDSADSRTALTKVNRSLRAEVASDDAYVRRMRPTFGYIMAVTWCAQMGAIAWVIVADPVQANLIITAMTSLGTIWSVGLSVLGIYVYKRSEE